MSATRPSPELVVCYRGVFGDWIPFAHFPRRELRDAVSCVRRMGQQHALKAEWCLRRKRKTILRMPVPAIGAPALRAYVEAWRAGRKDARAWDNEAAKQRYIQWPAAWADEMLKARQS